MRHLNTHSVGDIFDELHNDLHHQISEALDNLEFAPNELLRAEYTIDVSVTKPEIRN